MPSAKDPDLAAPHESNSSQAEIETETSYQRLGSGKRGARIFLLTTWGRKTKKVINDLPWRCLNVGSPSKLIQEARLLSSHSDESHLALDSRVQELAARRRRQGLPIPENRIEDVLIDIEDILIGIEDILIDIEDVLIHVEDVLIDIQDALIDIQDVLIHVEDMLNDVELIPSDVDALACDSTPSGQRKQSLLMDHFANTPRRPETNTTRGAK